MIINATPRAINRYPKRKGDAVDSCLGGGGVYLGGDIGLGGGGVVGLGGGAPYPGFGLGGGGGAPYPG